MRSGAAERRQAAAPTGVSMIRARSGRQPVDGGAVDLQDAVDAQPARPPLVGERGVEEAVAHHPAPGRQRRPHDPLHQLGAGGGEEVGLGHQAQLPRLARQHDLAHALAQQRPPGLAGARHPQPALLQGVGEQAGLRRLAAAVDALERDEARRYQTPTRTAATTTATARATHRARPAHRADRDASRGAQRTSASSARRARDPPAVAPRTAVVAGLGHAMLVAAQDLVTIGRKVSA